MNTIFAHSPNDDWINYLVSKIDDPYQHSLARTWLTNIVDLAEIANKVDELEKDLANAKRELEYAKKDLENISYGLTDE